MKAPNDEGYNWDKALELNGIDFMRNVIEDSNQLYFKGDWEVLGSFFLQLQENYNKSNDECLSAWATWKIQYKSRTKGINLDGINLSNMTLRGISFPEMKINDIKFVKSIIEDSSFMGCKMDGVSFNEARISNTDFSHSTFENLESMRGYLSNCKFIQSKFNKSNFNRTMITDCEFKDATFTDTEILFLNISNTSFLNSSFEKSDINSVNFYQSKFLNCFFDNESEIYKCDIDKDCIIKNTNYDNAISEETLRSKFLYCNRRTNWEHYYKKIHPIKARSIKLFWFLSDYGYSTSRPLSLFFFSSLLFGVLYILPAFFLDSWGEEVGMVNNLLIYDKNIFGFIFLFFRSMYFSIITMTTLGFGDIYANEYSILGHILLTLQVLLGYFTLAIIITRLSTLFTQNGPTIIPHGKRKNQKKLKKNSNGSYF